MGDSRLLAPACGRILEISDCENDPGVGGPWRRVSIFLALWDDHVTRAPMAAAVESIRYTPGKFGMALFKKNLLKNENNLIWFSDGASRAAVRQIAGRIAKRIVCEVGEGEQLRAGQRIGEIKFGSCVQLYFSRERAVLVKSGQKVKAGETCLA